MKKGNSLDSAHAPDNLSQVSRTIDDTHNPYRSSNNTVQNEPPLADNSTSTLGDLGARRSHFRMIFQHRYATLDPIDNRVGYDRIVDPGNPEPNIQHVGAGLPRINDIGHYFQAFAANRFRPSALIVSISSGR